MYYTVMYDQEKQGLVVVEIPIIQANDAGAWVRDPRDGQIFLDNSTIKKHYGTTKEDAIKKDIAWAEEKIERAKRNVRYHERYMVQVKEAFEKGD